MAVISSLWYPCSRVSPEFDSLVLSLSVQILSHSPWREIGRKTLGEFHQMRWCRHGDTGSFSSSVYSPGWQVVSVLHLPGSPAHVLTNIVNSSTIHMLHLMPHINCATMKSRDTKFAFQSQKRTINVHIYKTSPTVSLDIYANGLFSNV